MFRNSSDWSSSSNSLKEDEGRERAEATKRPLSTFWRTLFFQKRTLGFVRKWLQTRHERRERDSEQRGEKDNKKCRVEGSQKRRGEEVQEPRKEEIQEKDEEEDEQQRNRRRLATNVNRYRMYAASKLSTWLLACDSHHGCDCKPKQMSARQTCEIPEWVVDTQDGHIIPGHEVPRYAALSYFWPKDEPGVPRLMLTRSNMETFRTPGSLFREMHRLPLVVQETIQLVREVGERYLWIDCLCILQRDHDTKRQIEAVGSVYTGAYFTVVAAASSGLLDISDEVESVVGKSLPSTQHYESLMNSTWATRGWTFQEQVLSKRMIVFLDSMWSANRDGCEEFIHMFWDCQHSIWDASTPESTLQQNQSVLSELAFRPKLARPEAATSPDFRSFLELVCLYSGRDLTYPQDILVAFAGVLKTFPGRFVSGIPRAFIDETLVWQPHTQAIRRMNRIDDGVAPVRELPSWSWCGWQCLLDPNSLSAGLIGPSIGSQEVHGPRFIIKDKIDWVLLSLDKTREQPLSDVGRLPQCQNTTNAGDNSFDTTRSSAHVLQRTDQHFVGQADAPPTIKKLQPTTAVQDSWPFIACITRHARFRVRSLLTCIYQRRSRFTMWDPNRKPTMFLPKTSVFDMPHLSQCPAPALACSVLVLEDSNGQWAGVLRVMDDMRQPPTGDIELIAISEGEISYSDLVQYAYEENADYLRRFRSPGGGRELQWRASSEAGFELSLFMRWNSDEQANRANKQLTEVRPPELIQAFRSEANGTDPSELPGTYHFYNVLWIERKGDVAYRRAAGRIKKEVWERHCSEPAKVILG